MFNFLGADFSFSIENCEHTEQHSQSHIHDKSAGQITPILRHAAQVECFPAASKHQINIGSMDRMKETYIWKCKAANDILPEGVIQS